MNDKLANEIFTKTGKIGGVTEHVPFEVTTSLTAYGANDCVGGAVDLSSMLRQTYEGKNSSGIVHGIKLQFKGTTTPNMIAYLYNKKPTATDNAAFAPTRVEQKYQVIGTPLSLDAADKVTLNSVDHIELSELYIPFKTSIGQATKPVGSVTLTGGGSGSVDGIEVDSVEIMSAAVNFSVDLSTTAGLVAANINANTATEHTAVAVGTTIFIYGETAGTDENGHTVVTTVTTITKTDVNLADGEDLAEDQQHKLWLVLVTTGTPTFTVNDGITAVLAVSLD